VITRATLVLASVALVVGALAAGAPAWESPVQLSNGDRALAPELGSNANGDMLVVWDQEIGSACPAQPASLECIHIVEAASRGREGAWRPPVEITRPGVDSRPTAAVGEAGDGAILWVHDIGRDRVLQAVYRRGRSGAWPAANDLSEATLEIRDHAIAVDANGNAVAVWAERTDTAFAVEAATRPAASGAWGTPVTLSTPGADTTSGPSLALAPSGEAFVTWVEHASVVRVARRDATTGAWSAATEVSRSSQVRAVHAAVNAAGDAALAWVQQRAGGVEERVHVAYRRRGEGWSGQIDIPTLTAAAANDTAVAVDGAGNVVVVWIAGDDVDAAARSAASGAWTGAVPVSVATRASDLRLAVDPPGNAVAAWTSSVAGAVQTALRPAASGRWGQPLGVSPPPSSDPHVTLDSSGAGLAVWDALTGERAAVMAAPLEGAAVIAQLRVPTRAALGARTPFVVAYVPWTAPLVGSPQWAFGDGGSATGTSVLHAYARFGRYKVVVTQADGAGRTSSGTATIVVGAPRNLKRPSIDGKTAPERTLTCRHGGWNGKRPIVFRYRWLRHGSDIAGATRRRYRVRVDDLGLDLGCRVRAENSLGATVASARAVRVGL
jgi:hypothetical protein